MHVCNTIKKLVIKEINEKRTKDAYLVYLNNRFS